MNRLAGLLTDERRGTRDEGRTNRLAGLITQTKELTVDPPLARSRLADPNVMIEPGYAATHPVTIEGMAETITQPKPPAKPKTGFIGALIERPLENVPFIGGIAKVQRIEETISAARRLKGDKYEDAITHDTADPFAQPVRTSAAKVKENDIKMVEDYLLEQDKEYTLGGHVGRMVSQMPGFMVEFMATGGLQKLGNEAAKKAGTKLLGRYAATKAGKAALATGGFAIGTAARAAGMPQRAAEAILKRQTPKSIEITDEGVKVVGPVEKPFTSIYKGLLDHYIEVASEQAGEITAPLLSKGFSKLPFMGKVVSSLKNRWVTLGKGTAAEFYNKISSGAGFHGVISEIGEEYLGDISRAITGVEGTGPMLQRIAEAVKQDTQMVPAMAIAFSVPGLAGRAAGGMAGLGAKEKPVFKGDVQPILDEIRREAAAARRQREEIKRQKEGKFETEVSEMEAELAGVQKGAMEEAKPQVEEKPLEKPYEIQEWAKQFDAEIYFNKNLEWDYSHQYQAGTSEIYIGTKGLSANDIKLVTLHEIGHNVEFGRGTFHPEIKDSKLRREVDATEWALENASKYGVDTSNAVNLFTKKVIDLVETPAKPAPTAPAEKPSFAETTEDRGRIDEKQEKEVADMEAELEEIQRPAAPPLARSRPADTEGKAVAPEAAGAEKEVEPTVTTPPVAEQATEEEYIREMSSAETKAITRQIEDEIRRYPVYQEYETGLTETKSGNIKVGDLAGGKYYIPKQYKGELEGYAGTPFSKHFNAGLWNKFTFNPNEGSQWDIVAAEREMDIGDVSDFIQAVKEDIENFRKQGTLVEAGLKGMREAAKTDPYCELLLEKWRMARYGHDYNEINDYIDQWADDYGIPPEQAVDEYVGPNATLYKKIAAMPDGEEKQRQIDYLADVEAMNDLRKQAAAAADEVLKANGIEAEIEQVEEIEGLPEKPEDDIPFETRGKPVGAAFTRAKREIIQLAYGADSETGYHEGYHIIRKRLTTQDIKALDRQFKGDEEAEARAFAEFMTTDKAPTSFIRHAWLKLKALLTKIRAGLQGKGFRTAADIFGEIRAGTVGLYGQKLAGEKGGVSGKQLEAFSPEQYKTEQAIQADEAKRLDIEGQAKFETRSERLRRDAIERAARNAAKARLQERLSKKPKVSRARLKIKLHDVTPPLSKDWTEKPPEPVTFLTEEPPPGKGKPPVTRVFDEGFYEQNRKKLRRSIWEMGGEMAERAVLEFDRTFSAMSSRLSRIDQGLKYAVRRFVFDVNKRTLELMVDAAPMVKGLKKMLRADRRDFKFAALNGDSTKIQELVGKYKLQEQYQKLRDVLNEIYDAGNEVGLDILYRGDYWPRMVKDTKGLLKYLKTTDKWSLIQQALFKRQEAAGGRELTDDEKAMVVNTLLRGFRIGGISLSRPGFTKERTVEAIDRQIERFYYDINESLPIYIERMTNAITAREFFGKQTRELQNLKATRSRLATRLYKLTKRIGYNKPWPQEQYDVHISEARKQFEQVNEELQRRKEQTVEDSIGWYIKDLVLDGKINPQQQTEIAGMLKGIFEPRGMRGAIRLFTKLAYIDVLANPEVAMTQLEELGLSFYKSKIRSSKAVLQALTGTSQIKLADIGVDEINQYMEDLGFGKAADKLMFMMRTTDMAGKQTYVNTAVAKLRAEAKSKVPHADFVNKMRKIFGGEMNQTIDDLKNDRVSDNVKFLAYCELADVQPIAITEMPEYYARAGNLRIFYMLKSFMIRRFDFLRNEALSRMKKPIARPKEFVKGLTKLIELVGILTMFGVGKDLLRHWFHGKLDDFDFSDSAIDNLLNFILLSKYNVKQIGREGVGAAVGEKLAPPSKGIDNIISDVRKGELKKSVRSIPVIGEPYYWWFGGGTETKKKRQRGLY